MPCAPCWTTTYGGRGEAVWAGVADGAELYRRLRALPGYGDEKARIFVAILGKTQGVTPAGWREAAGKFGDDVPRSVADITGPESLRGRPGVEAGPEGGAAGQAGPAALTPAR